MGKLSIAIPPKQITRNGDKSQIEASRAMAIRAEIDENAACKFFENGLLPSRAQLARDMDLRIRFAKAMFDQGKSIDQIAIALDANENMVKRYLGEKYALFEKAEKRKRDHATRKEVAIALYHSGMPLEAATERAGYERKQPATLLTDYLLWKHPMTNMITARSCELRYLIAFGDMGLVEAANHMNLSLPTARKAVGDFDWRRDATSLSTHAVAVMVVRGGLGRMRFAHPLPSPSARARTAHWAVRPSQGSSPCDGP